MLDLERFFPTFNFCLSTTFLEHYSKQKQQLVLTGGGKGLLGSGRLQDVLSKASISNRFSILENGNEYDLCKTTLF